MVARGTRSVVSMSAACCRLVFRRFASFCHSRPFRLFAPVFIGVCLGVAVNMTLVPYGEDSCETCLASQDPQELVKVNARSAETDPSEQTKQQQERQQEHQQYQQHTEPKVKASEGIKLPVTPAPAVPKKQQPAPMPSKKILRPVFAATELGIKEKLFVGVLTSKETLSTLGVAINRTLSPHATKIVYFLPEPAKGPRLQGMTVVTPPGVGVGQEASKALRHVSENWPDTYDFYLLMTDSTFVRGPRLMQFLETTSVGHALQLGAPTRSHRGSSFCPLQGGIVISQLVLSRVAGELDHCDTHFRSNDASLNLFNCLRHAANSACSDVTQHAAERKYAYYELQDFQFDRDIHILREDKELNNSVAIFPVKDASTFYKLHRYFCQHDLEESKKEEERTKQKILATREYLPADEPEFSWPLGVTEQAKARDQLNQFRWEYFSSNHIFFKDDFSNMDPLTGADKEDAREIVEFAVSRMRAKYGEALQFTGLRNGYRRFDPARGMDYILDLALTDTEGTELERRVHLLKPLSQIDFVPMPMTSEEQVVTLVLPVTYEEDDASVAHFLDQYEHVCLEPGEKTELLVVFVHTAQGGEANKTYTVPKSLLAHYKKKYAEKNAKIAWTEVRTNYSYLPDLLVPDMLESELKPSSLVAMATTGMLLAVEYLSRIRMNVVKERQVFFPIGFWQYKPNLIYDRKPYPALNIEERTGHYDSLDTRHGAFFLADYQAARAACPRDQLATADVLHVFLLQGRLHVLRAVEPGLKHRFQQLVCPPSLPQHALQRCLQRRAKGLATRGQLAELVFQYEERKNKTSSRT